MKALPWPQTAPLGQGDVQLFWGRVGVAPGFWQDSLSKVEMERAGRFRFERDRQAFLARQSLLRMLLGRQLAVDSAALSIETGQHGKPYLADDPSLRFNLSHSSDLFLIALGRDRELGVDIQEHKALEKPLLLARSVFSPGEIDELAALPDAEQPASFFRGWTRKEAALKSLGTGFMQEARELHVGLQLQAVPGEPWSVPAEPKLKGRLLLDLLAPEGFSAALCVEGSDWKLCHFPLAD